MIEFVSLLLGLVTGMQTVEVRPAEPVARVEIHLDGEVRAEAGGPPWRFTVDLGEGLAPHVLAAVARDDSGREIGRAVQYLNLPRGSAEARWVLENGPDGVPAFATLVWEQMWGATPSTVDVRLDGRPLAAADTHRIPLPRDDPGALHFLSAEVTFPQGSTARAEAVYGGHYGDRVETELTALPVVTADPAATALPTALAGRFRSGGEALAVAAVDPAGSDLLVVRDRAAQAALARLVTEVEQRNRALFRRMPRDLLPMGDDARVRFVWPTLVGEGEAPGRRVDPAQFAAPQRFPTNRYGVSWLLSRAEPPSVPQRVADAVALAGLHAASGERRRAVVLALDPATVDDSHFEPAEVRRFLQHLRVPLVVWSVTGEAVPGWGEAVPVDSWSRLREATRELRRSLDRQAVVWVEGHHLPQQVELVEGELEVAWAGVPAAGAER